jgi:putative cell wall-binding protein
MVLLALALALGLMPALAPAAWGLGAGAVTTNEAVEPMLDGTLSGGERLTTNGSYQLASNANNGTITLADGVSVEIIGNGIDKGQGDIPNENITFIVGEGSKLTLTEVWLDCTTDINAIDFKGAGTLYSKGNNLIDGDNAGGSMAVIHVGSTASATFQGDADDAFFLYKNRAGSGIGSNENEQSGTMRFQSGNYFIKGSQVGAVIGNDSQTDAGSPIYIEGGRLYVYANARGAAIGASSLGISGPVVVSGGQTYVMANWEGSAIGRGGRSTNPASAGTLEVSGGSIKAAITSNGLPSWGLTGTEDLITDVAITAQKMDGAGNEATLFTLDSLVYVDRGETLTVTIDGKEFYSGTSYECKYQEDKTYTPANWVGETDDTDLYFYLSKQTHTIKVEDESGQVDLYDITWDKATGSFTAPLPDEDWVRFPGEDRYDTMKQIILDSGAYTAADVDTVIVARGDEFPDALAATSLAGITDAPVLLSTSDTLSAEAQEVIETLKPTTIYLAGGDAALSVAVEAQLVALMGGDASRVIRAAGEGREETALDIYQKGLDGAGWGDTAIIANGYNFADALSVSPLAYAEDYPIFLSDPKTGLSDATAGTIKDAIASNAIEHIIIVGGDAAVPEIVSTQLGYDLDDDSFITRLFGATRYLTSVEIAKHSVANSAPLGYDNLALAVGNNFPDALSGGAFAGRIGTVLLLVHHEIEDGTAAIDSIITPQRGSITLGYVLGGDAAIPDALMKSLEAASK